MSKKNKQVDLKTEPIKIEKSSNYCLSCNKLLTDEEHHTSILKEEDSQETGFERKDYCNDCWQKIQDKNYYLFWIKKRIKIRKDKKISKKERNQIILSYFNHLTIRNEELNQKKELEASNIQNADEVNIQSYQESATQSIDYRYHLYFIAHLLMKYGVFTWKKDIRDEKGNVTIIFENRYTDEEVIIEETQSPVEVIKIIKEDLQTYLKENQIELEII